LLGLRSRQVWVAILSLPLAAPVAAATCPDAMTSSIPGRASDAASGSRFAANVENVSGPAREIAIETELRDGNLPDFLRRLKPVALEMTAPGGKRLAVTVCVTPDYLAIGSDRDFLRIPMALPTALRIADAFQFTLPTRRMVDAIYAGAGVRLLPEPLPPGEAMRSTAYYVDHDRRIASQRTMSGAALDELIGGHKKDLVLTALLRRVPERVAIYGWHRKDGRPIQPLSTVHGVRYADYSHGVRLVSLVAYVDGRAVSLVELLQDKELAGAISDEGPIPNAGELMTELSGQAPGITPSVAQKAKALTRRVAEER
jgi:hypothetical protein